MSDKKLWDEPAEGYEVFCDLAYFDLWAARKIGVKSFCETAHFDNRSEAVAWTHSPRELESTTNE